MRLPLETWSHPWSCLEKQATEPDVLQFAFNKLRASVAPYSNLPLRFGPVGDSGVTVLPF